jgi:hypothetical protein
MKNTKTKTKTRKPIQKTDGRALIRKPFTPTIKNGIKVPKILDYRHPLIQMIIRSFQNQTPEFKSDLRAAKLTKGQILKKHIPFYPTEWSLGTQVPAIRLYSDISLVQSNGSGLINTVFTIQASAYTGFNGDLGAVFDEYRIVGAYVDFEPTTLYTIGGSNAEVGGLIGAIDYDDATPFASTTIASSYDTAKVFRACKRQTWYAILDYLPDQTWITTATINNAVAYLKMYGNATMALANSRLYGLLHSGCVFQFRLA